MSQMVRGENEDSLVVRENTKKDGHKSIVL